mmetsp:Transcript_8362/g.30571  ORF Transcript_8362/g.30571 Transcript_8362/m.30571 type:complete len:341 (+) Transcript_8362:934-1956(+)
MRPKKNGGNTRMGNTSNSSVDVKYAFTPYAPLLRSRKKSSRSSRHTGRDDSDMSARYRRMKKRHPMRFCIPPVSFPAAKNTPPRPNDATPVATKCRRIKNGCRRTFLTMRRRSARTCRGYDATYFVSGVAAASSPSSSSSPPPSPSSHRTRNVCVMLRPFARTSLFSKSSIIASISSSSADKTTSSMKSAMLTASGFRGTFRMDSKCASASREGPLYTTLPSLDMTNTRSRRRNMSGRGWWIESRIVTPSAPRPARMSTTFAALVASRPVVGSSRNITPGLVRSSVATLTLRFSPPLSPRVNASPMCACASFVIPRSRIVCHTTLRRRLRSTEPGSLNAA